MNFIDFFKKLIMKKTDDEKGGCLPSPQDYRDVPMSAVSKKIVKLPKEYNIPYYLRISNQGSKPHCVGYATATMKEERERREQNFIDFDGDWIYNECKKIDGIPNIKGTYFRAGMKVLLKKGAKLLNGEEYEPYRIGGYVRVENDFESLKQAIYEYGIVVVGFRGSNQSWRTAYIRSPKMGERKWGHAVALVGWNENYIIGQNSWGDKKHNEGYFYFDEKYLPYEAWTALTDLPNNWKELINQDEEKPTHQFVKNLYFGMKNNEVKILQECLKNKGFFPAKIDCTNFFGTITLKAVKSFQERYNIYPRSGFVGPITRKKLNEIFS